MKQLFVARHLYQLMQFFFDGNHSRFLLQDRTKTSHCQTEGCYKTWVCKNGSANIKQ